MKKWRPTTHSSHRDEDFYKEPGQGMFDVLVFNLQEIMCAFLGSKSRNMERNRDWSRHKKCI